MNKSSVFYNEIMKHPYRVLVYISALHWLIDFACAFAVFSGYVRVQEAAVVYLYYNFAAFALQMPLGILADLLGRKTGSRVFAGKAFVIAGVLFTGVGLKTSVWLLGLGNALFHVGGGLLSIVADDQVQMAGRGLGIFVAPGAVGLYLGTYLGKFGNPGEVFPFIAVIGFLSATLLLEETEDFRLAAPGQTGRPGRIALYCFLIVVPRSWVGMNMRFSWNTGLLAGCAASMAIALGKAGGGFAAAKYGRLHSAVITLVMAAVLFAVPVMPAGLLALFLFNMTMPMTLYRLYQALPEQPGFAFGLLTFALFIGFVPKLAGLTFNPVLFAGIGCLISTGLFMLAERP